MRGEKENFLKKFKEWEGLDQHLFDNIEDILKGTKFNKQDIVDQWKYYGPYILKKIAYQQKWDVQKSRKMKKDAAQRYAVPPIPAFGAQLKQQPKNLFEDDAAAYQLER